MASVIDVSNALVNLISDTLFAPGYLCGAATTSLQGPTVRVYPGWPNPAQLDTDLLTGTVNVSVFTDPGAARLTTRYEQVWQVQAPVAPTFLATVAGQAVTFSGTVSTSQIAGIQLGGNAPATYRLLVNDTPSTVAEALAAMLPYASPTVNGATITFPSTVSGIVAKTASDVVSIMETRRQEQTFRITVWAPNPTTRTLISEAIDNVMAYTRRLTFPDSTVSNVPLSRGTYIDDVPQVAHEWRRDLKYAIEYPTVYAQTQTPMLFEYVNINGSANNPVINNPIVPDDDDILLTETGNFLTLLSGAHIELEAGP